MKAFALYALCFFGFALFTFGINLGSQAPQIYATIHEVTNTNYQISGIIGQENFTNNEDYDYTATTFVRPKKIVAIPPNTYTQNFTKYLGIAPGNTGLLVVDYDGSRVLLFPNITATNTPVTNSTQAIANFVFGQTSFTDSDSSIFDDIYSVDYNAQGIYILADDTVFFFRYTSLNLQQGYSVSPDSTFGNCTTCNTHYLDDAYDMVVRKSTGEVIIADSGCERVIVFPANAGPTTEASYVIGQADVTQCDEDCDDSTSSSTCFDDLQFLTLDPQENLYVSTYPDIESVSSYSIYYFSATSKYQTAVFAIVSNYSDFTDESFYDMTGIVAGPGQNQITVYSEYACIVVQLDNYVAGYPTGAHNLLAFGYPHGGLTTGLDQTNGVQDIYGCAFLNTSQGITVFLADTDNNRIVSFLINSGTASPYPSQGNASPAASLSNGASQSNTATASLSFGASPSNSPIYYSYSYSFSYSAASGLSSWLNLIF